MLELLFPIETALAAPASTAMLAILTVDRVTSAIPFEGNLVNFANLISLITYLNQKKRSPTIFGANRLFALISDIIVIILIKTY